MTDSCYCQINITVADVIPFRPICIMADVVAIVVDVVTTVCNWN